MAPSFDKLCDMVGKNATLSRHARRVQQNLYAAAEAECERLSKLIDCVSYAGVLTDDSQAEAYQSWIMQRAGLQRLLAQNSQSTNTQRPSSGS
jgi:hypothetical protein